MEDLYGFTKKPEEEVSKRVSYLLENDRFQCHPSKYEVCPIPVIVGTLSNVCQTCGFHFVAPEIAQLLYHKWFCGKKMHGQYDKTFLGRLNETLLCLTTACLYHALKAWSTGAFVQPADFSMGTANSKHEMGDKGGE